jgi:acyl-CoA thioesterase-1
MLWARMKPNPDALADERLILAFGDSLIAGYGVRRDEGFAPQLEAALARSGVRARVVNAGVSGNTTGHARARVRYTLDAMAERPDLAIVAFGGNDMLRGVPPEETREDLDAVLAEFGKREIPVVLAGMLAPPFLGSGYTRAFNALFGELAREHRAGFYPFMLAGVAGVPRLNQPDRVHPNAEGVRTIAAGIAPTVLRALGR